jgi:hypothetical protein
LPLSKIIIMENQNQEVKTISKRAPIPSSLARGSIGLVWALAGALSPYGLSEYSYIANFLSVIIIWELCVHGLFRLEPAYKAHKAFVPFLGVLVGILPFVLSPSADGTPGPLTGSILILVGSLFALLAPYISKKADSKLPPAPEEALADSQFSKSFLAYLFVLIGLSLPWSGGEVPNNGLSHWFGVMTFAFCFIGAWTAWSGVWKMWSMPSITSGALGLVLFLAPLDAIIYGLFGVLGVVMGDQIPEIRLVEGASTGYVDGGIGPSLVLFGGLVATYQLIVGAKKGLAANKAKKEAEIEARKAARKAKKEASSVKD